MSEKELYRLRLQAELDEWKAKNAMLKVKVAVSKAEAQLEMKKQVALLESRLEDAQQRLSELSEANEDGWHSLKNGVESAWESMKFAFRDTSFQARNYP